MAKTAFLICLAVIFAVPMIMGICGTLNVLYHELRKWWEPRRLRREIRRRKVEPSIGQEEDEEGTSQA